MEPGGGSEGGEGGGGSLVPQRSSSTKASQTAALQSTPLMIWSSDLGVASLDPRGHEQLPTEGIALHTRAAAQQPLGARAGGWPETKGARADWLRPRALCCAAQPPFTC
ncbi:hypothetical protein NQZ68_037206 [Dissostichus eleginoides]|nr:hypothetical protein NQZ68_037206 [Dissostichus eleginoides]